MIWVSDLGHRVWVFLPTKTLRKISLSVEICFQVDCLTEDPNKTLMSLSALSKNVLVIGDTCLPPGAPNSHYESAGSLRSYYTEVAGHPGTAQTRHSEAVAD